VSDDLETIAAWLLSNGTPFTAAIEEIHGLRSENARLKARVEALEKQLAELHEQIEDERFERAEYEP
jgi:cell division protein FtsB